VATGNNLIQINRLMTNERKTEKLVRDRLNALHETYKEKTGKHVWIEEQKSDKPRIRKLLKNASKSGSGAGFPEFIVTFEDNSNLLMVIECKADVKKHRSDTLDQYGQYAVDGALLYASYLSEGFDVIAVGVSGENETELQIDTFFQTKGGQKPKDLEIKELFAFGDYLNIPARDPERARADSEELMKYPKSLNQRLRGDFEFEEADRPLMVSGILLALEDDGFCSAYPTKQKPSEIANLLLTAIKERLERDNIADIKKETMIQTYSFLNTNTKIITETTKDGAPNTLLKELIKDTEDNIRPFAKDYRFHDILGTFYVEFLRYANGDGGLGIVLTPPHITEMFSELAEINKDSVIIDNCCGTGGFLISAMQKMESAAQGNEEKLRHIHEKQIIGIENNAKMFCLACSNMMLRGDGKSNIHQQDCFQIADKEVKNLKPTVAFLNPPYSKEKKENKELAFVENALSFLEPHGKCVAIVPQSCAMNTKKENRAIKKRLLKSHTLKAVMSMPDTLFESSKKSVVTCILVFEAHKPHNKNTKTWFGYWKDDGFIRSRQYGRVDFYRKYENEIKGFWLNSYRDMKEIEGFSVLKHVENDDEWLVEPYIQTKFENLQNKDFEGTLKEYSTFLFYNEISGKALRERHTVETLSLDFKKWKEISLGGENGLFAVKGSKTTDKRELDGEHTKGKRIFPYITAQTTNNGARGFYDTYTEDGNILTIESAAAGFCSYQPFNFTASDHVEKLIPKFDLNVYRAMFLVTVINQEQYRYSYGRKFNQDRIRNTVIKLPFKSGKVDWDFIEKYIKGLKYSKNIETNRAVSK